MNRMKKKSWHAWIMYVTQSERNQWRCQLPAYSIWLKYENVKIPLRSEEKEKHFHKRNLFNITVRFDNNKKKSDPSMLLQKIEFFSIT